MTHKEIRKRVYDKYPVSKSEMCCAEEKRIMDRLREVYMKKLYEQGGEKRDWQRSAEGEPKV